MAASLPEQHLRACGRPQPRRGRGRKRVDGRHPRARGERVPGARVVTCRNRGFSHGNNQGWLTCKARYALFLNPDTEVLAGTFADFVSSMDERPTVGLVGVKQIGADGTLQPTIRRFPSVTRALGEALGSERWPVRPAWAGERELDQGRYEEELEIDWTSGSFMLAHREALLSAGLLDERSSMYTEEPDLCPADAQSRLEDRASPGDDDPPPRRKGGTRTHGWRRRTPSRGSTMRRSITPASHGRCSWERSGSATGSVPPSLAASEYGRSRRAASRLALRTWPGWLHRRSGIRLPPLSVLGRVGEPADSRREALSECAARLMGRIVRVAGYGVVTPVQDEENNLRRLAESMVAQTRKPVVWVVVDNGSTDRTPRWRRDLAREHDWVISAASEPTPGVEPGDQSWTRFSTASR